MHAQSRHAAASTPPESIPVMAEGAVKIRDQLIMIDVKGELPNLLLAFPKFDAADLVPRVEPAATSEDKPAERVATELNAQRRAALSACSIGELELRSFAEILLPPRWTMSLLRGPLTQDEIRRALSPTKDQPVEVNASDDQD